MIDYIIIPMSVFYFVSILLLAKTCQYALRKIGAE